MNADYWVEKLEMERHPEGGYYKEVYRNPLTIQVTDGGKVRNLATSIYFLLKEEDRSHFHQLRSDEIWYFHAGDPVTIHVLNNGEYYQADLGLEGNACPQILLPAQSIFGAEVKKGGHFCLMGCVVNPGFDFKDFRMVGKEELLKTYPTCGDLIEKFALN